MPGSFSWTVPTTRALAVGETLIVAVGGDSHLIDNTQVRLGNQALARIDGGVRSPVNRAAIVLFSHRVTAAAAAGTTLSMQMAPSSEPVEVCTQAVVLASSAAPLGLSEAARGQGASGSAITIAPRTDSGTVVMAAWFKNPALPATTSGDLLGALCAGDGSPCMVVASVVATAAPTSLMITPSADQAWSAALIGRFNSDLFSDGFE